MNEGSLNFQRFGTWNSDNQVGKVLILRAEPSVDPPTQDRDCVVRMKRLEMGTNHPKINDSAVLDERRCKASGPHPQRI